MMTVKQAVSNDATRKSASLKVRENKHNRDAKAESWNIPSIKGRNNSQPSHNAPACPNRNRSEATQRPFEVVAPSTLHRVAALAANRCRNDHGIGGPISPVRYP